jgi:hypothetical protein
MAITNQDEFKAWLKTQDQPVHVAIAARASLRCFPAALKPIVDKRYDSEFLMAARAILTSTASLIAPTADMIAAAEMSVDPKYKRSLRLASTRAAFSAATATIQSRTSAQDAVNAVILSTYSARGAAEFVYNSAYRDCTEEVADRPIAIFYNPLWEGKMPAAYTDAWDLLSKTSEPDLAFWRNWYRGFLDGAPLDWELQKRVALIPNDVWEQGNGAVAEAIREIEAEYLAEQSSLAEDVFYNDETARIARRVVPQAQPKTMANMLAALRDDLEDASSGNLLSKTAYDYRTLDRMMTKYHRNPERVEMDVVKISGSLRRQIDAGDLPDAPEVEGLCTTLVEIGLEIRAQHPEIDEARLKRGAKAVQESSAAERKEILAGLDAIRATVEEDFAEEIIEDLEDVVEAKDGPPDEDATSRSGNRLAKIWLVLKKAVAGTGISAGAVVAINEALPVLQALWQIMAKLLGIG